MDNFLSHTVRNKKTYHSRIDMRLFIKMPCTKKKENNINIIPKGIIYLRTLCIHTYHFKYVNLNIYSDI